MHSIDMQSSHREPWKATGAEQRKVRLSLELALRKGTESQGEHLDTQTRTDELLSTYVCRESREERNTSGLKEGKASKVWSLTAAE